MSRLIWIYAVCKSLSLSSVALKELKGINFVLGHLGQYTIYEENCEYNLLSFIFRFPGIRGQRRPRPACASAQSDQGLRYPQTESLYAEDYIDKQ